MEETNIIRPSKFKTIATRVKSALGMDVSPSVYWDQHTIVAALMSSGLYQEWQRLYPRCNMMSWEWDFRDGKVMGIKLTQFRDDSGRRDNNDRSDA